jgi:hypothetical protein
MGSRISSIRTLSVAAGDTVVSARAPTRNTRLTFLCRCTATFVQSERDYRKAGGNCRACRQACLIRPKRDTTRRDALAKQWEHTVRHRDVVCVITGRRAGLVVHHLNNWAQFPAQRYDPGNGVLITRKLHDEFHNRFGHKTTREQFTQFYNEKLG